MYNTAKHNLSDKAEEKAHTSPTLKKSKIIIATSEQEKLVQ